MSERKDRIYARAMREREVAAQEAQAAALTDLAASIRLLLPQTANEVQNAMDALRGVLTPGGDT